jgi:hypothetical protein
LFGGTVPWPKGPVSTGLGALAVGLDFWLYRFMVEINDALPVLQPRFNGRVAELVALQPDGHGLSVRQPATATTAGRTGPQRHRRDPPDGGGRPGVPPGPVAAAVVTECVG